MNVDVSDLRMSHMVLPKKGESASSFEKFDSWALGLPPYVGLSLSSYNVPKIIAVGGGKGGVGKSFVSANIAAKLGRSGHKVLLIDMDTGGANIHTYLGMGRPLRSLIDFVVYENFEFSQVISKTQFPSVDLIAGGKDELWSFEGGTAVAGTMNSLWSSLVHCKERYGYDCVILDLGAGNHIHTVDFFTAAHLGIVTILPEPTSIENAYAFLKSIFSRLLDHIGMHIEAYGVADLAKNIIGIGKNASGEEVKGSYQQKLRSMFEQHPEFIEKVFAALAGRTMGFVVNQIRSQRDIDVGYSMQAISKDYFGFNTKFLGYLNYDEVAWKSLRNRRLMIEDFPHAVLAKRLTEISLVIEQLLFESNS
ncbi:MAG: AAA family ATPase [Bdellovibrionota bacterium]